MNKRIRAAAGVFVLIFTLLIFGAAAFEAVNAGHECEGGDCHICEQLESCERLLSTGAVSIAVCAAAAAVTVTAKRAARVKPSERRDTPVSLGVLLLN